MTKIGFDVDGVLANYTQAFLDYAHVSGLAPDTLPREATQIVTWGFNDHEWLWEELAPKVAKNPFWWLSIDRFDEAQRVMQERQIKPAAYITARPICSDVTAHWIKARGFPEAQVFTVQHAHEKLELVRALELTHFIDDRVDTADQMHEAGLVSYLLGRPYNVNYPTNAIRIRSIAEMDV